MEKQGNPNDYWALEARSFGACKVYPQGITWRYEE